MIAAHQFLEELAALVQPPQGCRIVLLERSSQGRATISIGWPRWAKMKVPIIDMKAQLWICADGIRV
jgi:hypothetical protein